MFNFLKLSAFSSSVYFKMRSQESISIKLYMPHEMAITKDGNVILSDRQNHRLSIFTKEGKLVKRLGEYGEGNDTKGGQFCEPKWVGCKYKWRNICVWSL